MRLAKGGATVAADHFRQFDVPIGLLPPPATTRVRWRGRRGPRIRLRPNWTAGVEYNHLLMQDRTYTFVDTTGAFSGTDRIRQDVDLVTTRINYPRVTQS
jgi:outer membrane immunogenic protein